ncbi:MAG: cytochrome C oxidase Cbb3 [Polyangiaceae bacterium]
MRPLPTAEPAAQLQQRKRTLPWAGRWLAVLCAVALVAACNETKVQPAGPAASGELSPTQSASASLAAAVPAPWLIGADEPRGNAQAGAKLVADFECGRCHTGREIKPIRLESHCISCHQKVMRGGFDHKPEHVRWKKNVVHLTATPSLWAVGRRWRYGWLVKFLRKPHDLRPALVQTMPQLALTQQQARDIATFLTGDFPPDPTADAQAAANLAKIDASAGHTLLNDKGCGSCHEMSGVAPLKGLNAPEPGKHETRPAVILAPDLRFVRDRFRPGQLANWLRQPHKLKRDTPMPETPMSPSERDTIAAYLLYARLEPVKPHVAPKPLPLLSRRVGYAEVAEQVLDVTCRHCHGNPDDAVGDGGPGNTGGFGYRARGVNLTSYKYVAAGYLDAEGARHSLFEKMPDGQPRLIAALWARHAEVSGSPVKGLRGMPLGLPPLKAKEIQLIASWVAQGRPR